MNRAHQVDIEHQFEIIQIHLGEGLVTQDACIVHQNINTTPRRHGLRHHGLNGGVVRDRSTVCQSLSTRSPDLRHHRLSGSLRTTRAIAGATQIIDQYLCATGGQRQCVLPTQSTTRPGHDGNTALVFNRHNYIPEMLETNAPADSASLICQAPLL